MYPACANAGDSSKVSSDSIVWAFLITFVTAEGVVAKYIVIMVSACATVLSWSFE